jgi:hypothetical protein
MEKITGWSWEFGWIVGVAAGDGGAIIRHR